MLIEIEGGEDDHARGGGGPGGGEEARRLDAIHDRHADVHQHHVRSELPRQRHGLQTVRSLPHDREAGARLDNQPKADAHQRLVVGDQHRDGHRYSSGSRTRTANPPSATTPVVRSPWKRATRSRIPISPRPSFVPGAGRVVPRPSSRISNSSASSP